MSILTEEVLRSEINKRLLSLNQTKKSGNKTQITVVNTSLHSD